MINSRVFRSIAVWVALLPFAALPAGAAQVLRGHVPEAVAASRAVGPMARNARMNLSIELPLRNQDELDDLLKQLIDPANPNFRQYLTAEQFAERFGPTQDDYQALTDFATAHGLQVTGTHPNRMILDVNGTAADIERALHVNLMRWRHAARGEFFAPDTDPQLDTNVQILAIGGLNNFALPHPMDLQPQTLSATKPLTTGSGPAGLFIGNDFRAAYAPAVTLNGAGQSVGLFELDGFYVSDVAANFKQAGLPAVPVQTVLLDGFNGAPGSANVEVILDIMMAAYMAPGAANIIVYEGTNWNDVLNRMATDNTAKQLSSSWCFYPTNATTEQIFKQMIAQGQSLFQASGDSGAYGGWIMPPADDPNVTVVGGTSLTTAGSGGAWKAEATWSGSGGGVSTVWPIPSYQQSAVMTAAGGSTSRRNIPDVALTADIQMFLICNNGQSISVGGTSAAAPLWAGFMALANQQAVAHGKPVVGFMNPPLYKIGSGSSATSDLHDITSGNNSGFAALPGYDLTTGWGSPSGQGLINDLTGISNPPAFSLSLSAATLALAQGSNGAVTVTINPQSNFSGTVNLAVSGLPAGVTASFTSVSAVTTSTLTLTASATAAPGAASITITGTSGTLTGTAKVALTVTAPPSFTLTATPNKVSVPQSGSATSSIAVGAQNSFTGAVALAATGLPNGVTAALSPISTSGTSTLTLTASATATLGSSTITVTGTSGSLKSTTTITLTVSAPVATYTITAAPASLNVVQGASSAPSTISVVPAGGFAGTVALSATGMPAGVTATFSPASTAHTSNVTFNATANAAPGTSTVTITATSGSLSSKTTIAVTVTAAPGFTLTATPTAFSMRAGSSGSSTLTANPQSGFTGTVSLAVTGLPAGVTAVFSSPTTKTTSTLTLTAATTAAATTTQVIVTGTSGALTGKATIAVTVTPPPTFTLSPTPAALSVGPGLSGIANITVNALNGFTGTVALTASGMPTGMTATFSAASTTTGSTVTFAVPKTAANGTSTVTITGVSGTLTAKTTIALTVAPPPTFILAASPATLSVAMGTAGKTTLTLTSQNGFTGAVSMTLSGLPAGVVGSFTAGGTPATSTLTLTATAAAVPGTSTVTVTGQSDALSKTATIALTVLAPAGGSSLVNLASLYNVGAMVTDGSTFTSGGLDAGGRSYSANLLGTVQTYNGTPFCLGPANAPGAVSSATIPLPAGQFSTLKMLATGVNGNQTAQTFTVSYTDGTTAAFTQNLSDWCAPQAYSGETQAVPMTYRNNSNGTRDSRPLAVYGYTFNLSGSKTVSSITLPKNRNVVVLGISLVATATAAVASQVNLAPIFDTIGMTTDGRTFSVGIDGVGNAYSATLLGSTQTVNKTLFKLGTADAANAVSGNGKTVTLPPGNFSTLQMLATGVEGNQLGQTFKVTYTDGVSSTFTQSFSDWLTYQGYAGEFVALKTAYRNVSNGTKDNRTFQLYAYSFTLNSGKTVSTIQMPSNPNVKVLAMTLMP